jgi:hypothetical protein
MTTPLTRWLTAAAVAALLAVPAAADPPKADEPECGSFGTAVEFVATPREAAEQAKKEQKLVFVLHVSGHFEDPGLT